MSDGPGPADRKMPGERVHGAGPDAQHRALRAALQAALAQPGRPALAGLDDQAPEGAPPAVRTLALSTLADTGLAHEHIRLLGTPWLARLPKQSQMDLPAERNLAYQAACFERAAAGGHTPRLGLTLQPGLALPRGGLLVEMIHGRAPDASHAGDLAALMQALASLHALALPPASARAPLLDPPSPLAALRAELMAQARHLEQAALAPATRRRLLREIERFSAHPALRSDDRCLVAFDAHPGNFLIEAGGRAVLVDLEKARYGHPGCDLAHATLYTSTTWPMGGGVALDDGAVLASHRHWARCTGPAVAERWWPTLGLARLGMALWALTWCAKWRVLSASPAAAASGGRSGDGEDWSAERSAADLVRHVRERVDHYLDDSTVAAVLDGCVAIDHALAASPPGPA